MKKLNQFSILLKIQITEKKYVREKQGGKNYEETVKIQLKGNVGALFCTVDKEKEDFQMDSRTLNTTTVKNNRDEKFKFQDLIKNEGTECHNNYNKIKKESKIFKEYLKCKINKYNKKSEKTVILNPFIDSFLNITKHSLTDTRKATNLQNMFKVYLILDYENSIIIENENIKYILPKLKHLKKFIDLSFNNAGLKLEEKNLIMKLKEEVNPIMSEEVETLYEEIYNSNSIEKTVDESNKVTVDILMSEYGLTERRNKNSDELKQINYFTPNTIKRKFKNHKTVKDISNIQTVLNNLEKKGYMGKLPEKHRKQNVYYLNKNEIKEIKKNYKITKKDLDNAKKYLYYYQFETKKIIDTWNKEFKKYNN